MKAHVDALFLNALCHPKKVKGEYYYTLSFLDNDDNSYNTFISKEIYDNIARLKITRFAIVYITLNIYKNKDGQYTFTPVEIDVVPFKNDLQDKQNKDK